jgi:hypothetical protein
VDPASEMPHIYNHRVDEDEVIEVLEKPGEDRPGRDGSRVALGQTASGRYLRVIYVPDPEPESVFVITAYELGGKPLAALRRRRKRKRQ